MFTQIISEVFGEDRFANDGLKLKLAYRAKKYQELSRAIARPSAQQLGAVENLPPRQQVQAGFYKYLFAPLPASEGNLQATLFVVQNLQAVMNDPRLLADLPAMPDTVTQVINMLQSDDFNISELLSLIEKEPGMAAELIKLANSARYFRGDKPVSDIRVAFNYMGSSGMMDGVLQTFLQRFSPSSQSYFQQFGSKIWQHCYDTAINSQLLASIKLGPDSAGVGFFVGLIRNIGHMVLFQLMTESFKYIEPNDVPDVKTFQSLLDRYSLPLTVLIAKRWQLPNGVTDALEQQSRENTEPNPLALLVRNAELISQYQAMLQAKMYTEVEYEVLVSAPEFDQTTQTIAMQFLQQTIQKS